MRRRFYYRREATQFRHEVQLPVVFKCTERPVEGTLDPRVRTMGKGEQLHL